MVSKDTYRKLYVGHLMVMRLMMSRDPKRWRSCLQYLWGSISRQPCKIDGFSNWSCIEKHIVNPMFTWPLVSRVPNGDSSGFCWNSKTACNLSNFCLFVCSVHILYGFSVMTFLEHFTIANNHLFNNIGGHFLYAAYLMGLISVKQFYVIPIIFVLEKHGESPRKALNFGFGMHYEPWSKPTEFGECS